MLSEQWSNCQKDFMHCKNKKVILWGGGWTCNIYGWEIESTVFALSSLEDVWWISNSFLSENLAQYFPDLVDIDPYLVAGLWNVKSKT